MDRHDLYELCVQSPTHLVPLIRAIHGANPLVLAEDFCGTASLSHEWAGQVEGARAIGVDADSEVIARARARNTPNVQLIQGDVIDATNPIEHGADVLFVGNFSIGYWHTRPDLLRYLRHAHARLAANTSPERKLRVPLSGQTSNGPRARNSSLFLCDTYGGDSAFVPGHVHRDHRAPGGRLVRYTWEQREADPLTGMVLNALHFRVSRAGIIEQELHDAFTYHWRLWSVPELRDAMLEAGFTTTEVYAKVADAIDDEGNVYVNPVAHPDELEDSFIVLVAART